MAAVEFRKSGSLKGPRKEPMWSSLFPILALPILLLGILGLPTVPQMLRQHNPLTAVSIDFHLQHFQC